MGQLVQIGTAQANTALNLYAGATVYTATNGSNTVLAQIIIDLDGITVSTETQFIVTVTQNSRPQEFSGYVTLDGNLSISVENVVLLAGASTTITVKSDNTGDTSINTSVSVYRGLLASEMTKGEFTYHNPSNGRTETVTIS